MPPDPVMLVLALCAPLVCGLVAALVPGVWGGAVRTGFAALGYGAAFGLLALVAGGGEGEAAVYRAAFLPELGIDLHLRGDRLGLFFALLVSGMGLLIALYARSYFRGDCAALGRLYALLGAFATGMLGIALSDSLIGFFVFWELTTVSSFLLIGWDRGSQRAVRSALHAFAITGTGGICLLGGLVLMGVEGGAWTFSALEGAGLSTLALVLVFIGAAAKSAQFPIHSWLPGAMAAPTPVSAYLHSATMVKAGVFLLARTLGVFEDDGLWSLLLVLAGSVTMAYAGAMALGSDAIKRMLAYTTVSQLGLFVAMYGLADHLDWPIAQILNHALYKAPLFMLAGACAVVLGVKHVRELRGLARRAPLLAALFLLGMYAMAALPGTFSFAAKELFVSSAFNAAESSWLGVCALAGVGVAVVCNVALFVRMARVMLGGPAEEGRGRVAWSSGLGMWAPAALLIAAQCAAGVAPGVFEPLVRAVETHPDAGHLSSTLHVLAHPGPALWFTLIVALLGFVVGVLKLFNKEWCDPCDGLFVVVHRLLEQVAFVCVSLLQSGSIRRYLGLTLIALVGMLALTVWPEGRWRTMPEIVPLDAAPVWLWSLSIVVGLMVCGTAGAMTLVRTRVVRVLVLGGVGFGVTIMYLIYRAPDLALTQIMFEIISVILFLLALRMLPERTRADRERFDIPRAAFALVVGGLVGLVVLHSGSAAEMAREERLAGTTEQAERLGPWFLRHSHDGSEETAGRGGGGDNVVNVILVDFRGYDTLGEVTVLTTAMFAVLAMLGPRRLRPAVTGSYRPPGVAVGPQPRMTSTMLRVAFRAILPLVLTFSAYVFFKGHQLPGGGFVAGLIASVGLAAYRMAEGRGAIKRILPVKPAVVAAAGLLLILGTGVAPMLAGLVGLADPAPLLTSAQWYIDRPGADPFHLPSVLFFDLGVFVVVVGVSTGMINRFEEELE